VRVIPILIKGAAMPGKSDLPESLRGLAGREAFPIRADSFRFDVERLVLEMSPAYRWRRLSLAVGVLLMLAAVSFIAQSFTSVASVSVPTHPLSSPMRQPLSWLASSESASWQPGRDRRLRSEAGYFSALLHSWV
jgi:hypothetical protein